LLGAWLVTLVAPSVQMWIDRSLVGYHASQVLPFEDLASEQSSLEMVFQGLVVELSWEPAAPDATKYLLASSSGGYLGVSIDSEARREEEERVEDLVKINLRIRVPKLDVIDLVLQLAPQETRRRIFDWTYQKNRSSETLVSGDGRSSLPGSESDRRPEFTLKDQAFETEWSQVYSKSTLTELLDLTIKFTSTDTKWFSRDVLTMQIKDRESEGETPE